MTFATLTPTVDIASEFRPETWRRLAACRGHDPDLFFPGQGDTQEPAKQICARCVVRLSCLEFGLGDEHGIYGGLSARERKQLRRKRRINPVSQQLKESR